MGFFREFPYLCEGSVDILLHSVYQQGDLLNANNSYLIKAVLKIISSSQFHLGFGFRKIYFIFVFLSMTLSETLKCHIHTKS